MKVFSASMSSLGDIRFDCILRFFNLLLIILITTGIRAAISSFFILGLVCVAFRGIVFMIARKHESSTE